MAYHARRESLFAKEPRATLAFRVFFIRAPYRVFHIGCQNMAIERGAKWVSGALPWPLPRLLNVFSTP